MGFLTESNIVGNIGLKNLREQREIANKRWGEIGLLEGLDGFVRENCAQLFENQLSDMINESTDGSSNGQFETVAFPVIRRVFAKLLANQLVSVQAISQPLSLLYFINPRISVRRNGTDHTSPDGAYSNAATATNVTEFEQKSLYDSYYATRYDDEGESLFDRSKGKITNVTGTCTNVTYNSGDKTAIVKITGFSTTSQGRLVGSAGIPMDTESFLASLRIKPSVALQAPVPFADKTIDTTDYVPYGVKSQTWGKSIVSPTGELELILDLTYPGVDGYQALTAATTPSFNFEYRTYSDLEEDSEMAEVSFGLDKVSVEVESRKMRSQWTPELAQDVSAFHNIDAEAELTALLSEQMAAEIDREVLRDLRKGAAWTLRWDYDGLRNQTNTYHGTQKDWNQTLVTKFNQISAQIHKAVLRGGASWIVVSPEVSAVLDDLEYFHVSNASPEQDKYNMGIEKVGTLSGRYQVYRDPYTPANTVLIGHRGNTILESGYIYSPYIPLQLTPVMYNPFDMKPVRGIMTRYAKKMVLNRYYGKVLCDNLITFSMV